MLIKLFVLSVFLFASGCDSGDRSSSLLGLDADRNGVRDDIQEYIDGLELTDQQRYFVGNYAASKQKLFLVDLDDSDAVLAYTLDLSQNMYCVLLQFNDPDDTLVSHKLIEKISKKTLNTKKRKMVSEKFDNATPLVMYIDSHADKCV